MKSDLRKSCTIVSYLKSESLSTKVRLADGAHSTQAAKHMSSTTALLASGGKRSFRSPAL